MPQFCIRTCAKAIGSGYGLEQERLLGVIVRWAAQVVFSIGLRGHIRAIFASEHLGERARQRMPAAWRQRPSCARRTKAPRRTPSSSCRLHRDARIGVASVLASRFTTDSGETLTVRIR